MGIIAWIVLGLIAGILGRLLLPGRDPGGWLVTIALGIAGAFVGGFLGSFFGLGSVGGGINLGSITTATIGAIVLLAVYRQLNK